MSTLISSFRIVKFALQNIFRNIWLSLATITIFVLTLITVNAVLFVSTVANSAVKSVEEKVSVTVYFKPEVSDEIVKSAQEYVQGLVQVRSVQFKSAEDNLIDFKQNFAGDALVLESLEEIDENPLGASLIISADDSEDFAFILESLETPEFADSIRSRDLDDNAGIIQTIQDVSKRIRLGGLVLALFFAIVASLIIFNTVRVAIYVHRDEITIMKLVGASDSFVRGPFLIEAIIYSLVATLIACVLVLMVMFALQSTPDWYIDPSVPEFFLQNAFTVFGLQALGLSLLSVITTILATYRYLRV